MMRRLLVAWAWGLPLVACLAVQSPGVLRVACVGDSITQGDSAGAGRSYPEQLGRLLGEGWVTGNFGVNGATISGLGDRPYLAERRCAEALEWSPDVVVVMLGTNDSKARNWRGPEHLRAELGRLVDRFARLPSRPRVVLCRPIAVIAPGRYGITPLGVEAVRAAIDAEARARDWEVIDLAPVLEGRPELLPDGVHPDHAGAALLAQVVRDKLRAVSP
jgi:lysophospholipase L1-like esterase